jgi:hypothetical protein
MYRCDLTNRRLAHPSEASILAVSVSVAGSPQHQLGNLRLISLHPEQVRQDAIPEGGHLESNIFAKSKELFTIDLLTFHKQLQQARSMFPQSIPFPANAVSQTEIL